MDILKNVIEVKKILEDLISLNRLEKLAEKNQFIAMAYAEALMHTNYHILSWDAPTKMMVTMAILGPVQVPVQKTFPLTIEGKLAGIGQSFAHSAGKLDMLLGTKAVTDLVGMGEVAADIAKAVLGASRVSQQLQGLPPGYAIAPKKGFKLVAPKKAKKP